MNARERFGITFTPEDFERVYQEVEHFEISDAMRDYCLLGRSFARWSEKLLAELVKDATPISIAQAKILVLNQWWQTRVNAPRAHQDRLGSKGHVCIYQVFTDTVQKLMLLELHVTPPILWDEPPPKPVTPRIAGIWMGEEG